MYRPASEAVDLVTRLLDLNPHLQMAQAPQSHDQTEQEHSFKQDCAAIDASVQAQAIYTLRWSKPTPEEWKDIELVAVRACEFLGGCLQKLHNTQQEQQQQQKPCRAQ